MISAVFEVIASIIARYRYELKSQQLWEEVEMVTLAFQQPFLDTFNKTLQAFSMAQSDKKLAPQLPIVMKTLDCSVKIFHALNTQACPDFFSPEEHLKEFMGPFVKFLGYSNPALDTKGDDVPGPVEHLKAVCASLCFLVCFFSVFVYRWLLAVVHWRLLCTEYL